MARSFQCGDSQSQPAAASANKFSFMLFVFHLDIFCRRSVRLAFASTALFFYFAALYPPVFRLRASCCTLRFRPTFVFGRDFRTGKVAAVFFKVSAVAVKVVSYDYVDSVFYTTVDVVSIYKEKYYLVQ